MARLACWVLAIATLLGLLPQPAAAAPAAVAASADLRYMNRVIYTMRAPVAGASPERRAERALDRLRALPPGATGQAVERVELQRDGERVIALQIGGETVLTVFQRDLDADTGATLDDVAAASADALQDALAALQALRDPQQVARGSAIAVAGLPVVLLVAWLARRLRLVLARRLLSLVHAEASRHRILGVDWSDFGLRAVAALTRALGFVAVALLCFVWAGHALRQFPATRPLADEMRQLLLGGGAGLLGTMWRALPDVVAMGVVLLVARSVLWLVDQAFAAVIAGRLRLPGVHRETARATRRLVVFAVWGLALAAAYPYIPGSDSLAFQGLSVFLGAMFTLGSTGVVSQWMHGLVIVYARALRTGDFVRCGEHEGTVQELGPLSVKILDARGNEITLPNGTVVQGAIVNHSRDASDNAVRGSVRLSLGYDLPWKQVHALLKAAALRTQGVRPMPEPRVLERALGDFSIEYEVVVEIDVEHGRTATLAALMRTIRDVFDEAGFEILSPNFVAYRTSPGPAPGPAVSHDADASAPGPIQPGAAG